MTWRGSSTIQDRIFVCLIYILPVLESLIVEFNNPVFQAIPFLKPIFAPLDPLVVIYAFNYDGIRLVKWAAFLGLFLAIIRNHRAPHFLRFHVAQSVILDIFIWLCAAVLELIGVTRATVGLRVNSLEYLFWNPVISLIFIATIAGVIYSVTQSIRGLYAELPMLSEAAYRLSS